MDCKIKWLSDLLSQVYGLQTGCSNFVPSVLQSKVLVLLIEDNQNLLPF